MSTRTMTLPSNLPADRNGKLYPHELVMVLFPAIGMLAMHRNAARAWNAMALMLWHELGRYHQITAVSAGDVYRPFEWQERLFFQRFWRLITSTITKVYLGIRYWLKPGMANAATPGTSNHGWGLAVDIGIWPGDAGPKTKVQGIGSYKGVVLAWLRANAADFGFFENVKSEPWHWEFCLGDTIPQRVLDIEAFLGWPGEAA